MKYSIIFSTIFYFSIFSTSSQTKLDKYDLEHYSLKSNKELNNAEKKVLEISNILLDEPANQSKEKRIAAMDYLLEWMVNTENYFFGFRGKYSKLIDEREDLGILSCAAQIKYCLENNVPNSRYGDAEYQIIKIFMEYIANKNNKVKKNREIKKLIKELNKGNLKKYLESY